MPVHNTIYIIGFMGSGKSTAGKKLAAGLGWTYTDLDSLIEEYYGQKIPEIFSESGEEAFREIETKVLLDLKPGSKMVVSTGGGTPCFNRNMDYMLETGLTIYLRLTPAQLRSRLTGSSTVRPLISNISQDNLEDYITEKLKEREKWYERAEMIVDGLTYGNSGLIALVKDWLNSDF